MENRKCNQGNKRSTIGNPASVQGEKVLFKEKKIQSVTEESQRRMMKGTLERNPAQFTPS